MPQTRIIGKRQATGNSLGQKKPSWLESWFGIKETPDYPGNFSAPPSAVAYAGAIRIPPKPARQGPLSKGQAQAMMGDMMFQQQTGYNPDDLAFSKDFEF